MMLYEGIIIDAHIHPFICEKDCIGRFGTPATLEEMASTLRANNITRACGTVIERKIAESFEDIRKWNRMGLQAKSLYPDLFIPGIHVHGAFPEESAQEIGYMYEKENVRWIGELVAHSTGTGAYDSPGMFAIYETAVKWNMPVNIHCADLEVVENVVKNFPKLNVILAHPDDAASFLARSELVSRYENLYLDISGTGLFRWGMLQYCVKLLGAHKILFGTDFPICNPAMYVAGVLAEKLSEKENELIFAGNFLRLTGLAL